MKNKFERYSGFLTWFMALLLLALVAGCGGGGGGRDPILGLSLPSLASIAVTPATASVPVTGSQQFTATATFSDGSSRDVTATSAWSTSGASAANASVGPATGLATGVTSTPVGVPVVITATFRGLSGSANLTVNTATSVSFAVTPAAASIPVTGTQQFAAIETFSNGTTQDRTTTSVWSTSGASAANATVGAATGLATGVTLTAGVPVVINAKFGALVATPAALTVTAATSVLFVVSPDPFSMPVSGVQQYTATQIFSDGSTQNRTTTSSWTSGTIAVATMSADGAGGGVATGVAPGASVITATFGGLSDTATLTVNAATSVSFVVSPDPFSMPVGGVQQYTAIQTFSDGSTQPRTTTSSWTSGTLAVATMSADGAGGGVATGVTPGTSVITATFGGLSDTATLTVTAVAVANPGIAGAVDLLTATPFGLIAYDAMTINGAASHIFGDVALTQPGPGGTIASVTTAVAFVGAAPTKRSPQVTDTTSVPPTPGLITAADNGTVASIAALPQLRADLNNVFLNDLLIRAAPVTPLTDPASAAAAGVKGGTFAAATDLSGFVLRPGIYTTNKTYGLSNALGPLVLDAEGNADAVFIIRSTAPGVSGLTSTTGSVVLQNGAQAKNIYWVMSANATIGDDGANTFFQGTLVAGNVITLGVLTNVEGRMLAGARLAVSGAVTLSGTNIITVPK